MRAAVAALVALTGCADILGFDEGSLRIDGSTTVASSTASSSSAGSGGAGASEGGGGAGASDVGGSAGASTSGTGGCGSVSAVKRVFVSRIELASDFGGLQEGDDLCQALAERAGLCGSWRAWLSAGGVSAVARFSGANGPWYLVDQQTLIATSLPDLTDSFLAHPIDVDETGSALASEGIVWTGTFQTGQQSSLDCVDWTSTAQQENATVGSTAAINEQWTHGPGALTCDQIAHIYCFEQ